MALIDLGFEADLAGRGAAGVATGVGEVLAGSGLVVFRLALGSALAAFLPSAAAVGFVFFSAGFSDLALAAVLALPAAGLSALRLVVAFFTGRDFVVLAFTADYPRCRFVLNLVPDPAQKGYINYTTPLPYVNADRKKKYARQSTG